MSSKHPNAPWYCSQLGIDAWMPENLFKAVTPVSDPPSESTTSQASEVQLSLGEATVPVAAPSVPNDEAIEILEQVADAPDDKDQDPVSSQNQITASGID